MFQSINTEYYTFFSPTDWMIEFFLIGNLGSTRLRAKGLSPTKILLDGEYVGTTQSPGLMGRNR